MKHEGRDVWSVSSLNRYIKDYLDQDERLQTLWVRGEISNFKHHSRGHMYLTLKDEKNRIGAVMFARQNRRLKFMPKDGDNVLVRCYVSMYERGGQVQVYVVEMQPDGIGSLFLAYEQLKKKLDQEGLFESARKRRLPAHPRTVGVITSSSGAAVRDIVTTISRRSPFTNVLLLPAIVQGDRAPASVVTAIELANTYFAEEIDVLIVGRGGGSLEELWAFNEEAVARSIHMSDIPVIAAVGHETDVTITDFAADVRAATPTAAAELAVPFVEQLRQQVQALHDRLQAQIRQTVKVNRERLSRSRQSPVFKRPTARLREYEQRLDYLHTGLVRAVSDRLQRDQQRLERLSDRLWGFRLPETVAEARKEVEQSTKQLGKSMDRLLQTRQQRLDERMLQLDALSPLKVMQRGYSLVYRESDDQLVKSVRHVELGEIIQVKMPDGRLDCQVWGMEEKNHDGT